MNTIMTTTISQCHAFVPTQWNLSIKDTSLMRTLSAVHPMVASIERFHCIQDSQLGPNGGLYGEVPLYTGQLAGSQWCPL